MGRHLGERLIGGDRRVDRVIRHVRPNLPPDMRRTGNNIATIRNSLALLSVLVPVMIVAAVVRSVSEPRPDYGNLAVETLIAVIVLPIGWFAVNRRAQRVAPSFVEACCALAPDWSEEIRSRYAVRGLGDLVAPWNRRRWSVLRSIGGRLARYIDPRPAR